MGAPQMKSEPKSPMPKQHIEKPGIESELRPRPKYEAFRYKESGKLKGKKALITGGDSGIGRAVAILYAREGAEVTISCLESELADARETREVIEEYGRICHIIPGDLTDPNFCENLILESVKEMSGLDIIVTNAAHQNRKEKLEDIELDEWDRTFKTNIYAYFLLVKYALPHLKPGSAIIASSSVTALRGSPQLLDYSATKGAINAFTKALSQSLIDRGIRVNAVAPGPVWTPLNAADEGMDENQVSEFGAKNPYGRPAQPEEIAPAYVFLASDADSSYMTGVVLPQAGGEIVM